MKREREKKNLRIPKWREKSARSSKASAELELTRLSRPTGRAPTGAPRVSGAAPRWAPCRWPPCCRWRAPRRTCACTGARGASCPRSSCACPPPKRRWRWNYQVGIVKMSSKITALQALNGRNVGRRTRRILRVRFIERPSSYMARITSSAGAAMYTTNGMKSRSRRNLSDCKRRESRVRSHT